MQQYGTYCILYTYSTLSTVQLDNGNYRRSKHVVASLSHLCYKYICSCVLTTFCTILYNLMMAITEGRNV